MTHTLGARWRAVRARRDDGQVVLLVIAYAAVSIALVLVVVSASAVHLERKRLLEVADAAALDAADEVEESVYFPQGARPGSVPLSDRSVRDSVVDHLARRGAYAEFDDLTVAAGTGSPDGRTAEVTLLATVQPPLVGWAMEAFSDGVLLRATSRARADTG